MLLVDVDVHFGLENLETTFFETIFNLISQKDLSKQQNEWRPTLGCFHSRGIQGMASRSVCVVPEFPKTECVAYVPSFLKYPRCESCEGVSLA